MDLNPSAGIGDTPAPPRTTPAPALERLRRASLGSLLALLIQYGLGIGVNLFVNVPATDQGKGVGEAFGRALSHGPAALAAHTGIGLLLIINVIVVLVLAIRSRLRSLMISAVVGLLCVVGAAFSGANFVNTGANGASMAMAVLTGVALACYAFNLYLLGARSYR
jgi:hypothetical protein